MLTIVLQFLNSNSNAIFCIDKIFGFSLLIWAEQLKLLIHCEIPERNSRQVKTYDYESSLVLTLLFSTFHYQGQANFLFAD